MSDTSKSKPLIIIAVCSVVLIVSAWVVVRSLHPPPPEKVGALRYFTDDDGETFFTSETKDQPPIDHNGKPAVCAFLYSCDGGTTKQVAYLFKFDPNAPAPAIPAGPPNAVVKRKGDTEWVPQADWMTKGVDFFPRHCPDASGTPPMHCYP